MTTCLSKLHILNTRPTAQAHRLSQALKAHGARVTELPCLDIQINLHSPTLISLSKKLSEFDSIIFLSQNAAEGFKSYWSNTMASIIAVGPSTATSINQFSQTDIIPKHYSSEGILLLDEMQQLREKKILVVCGNNNNGKLQHELTKRGAVVNTATSYRVLPHHLDTNKELQKLKNNAINTVISTSSQSLQQLHTWFAPLDKTWLNNLTLVIISNKMLALGKQLGWENQQLILSQNATTLAITNTLTRHMTGN